MSIQNKNILLEKKNCKNTSLLFKGGKLIIQDDSQKGIENTYFDFFIKSKIGKEWYDKNKIIKKIEDEKPDFIFETSTGKIIGLEIINFIVKSDTYHEDKHKATARLKTIGNKVCHYFKQETGIALSLVIDIWDPRKWSSQWKDHIEHCYDPGFKHLNASDAKIKNAIIEALLQETIPSFGIVQKSIQIGNQIFIITADRTCDPHSSVNINNAGICKEDPFEELQIIINNKNGKYETYKNKSDECDLLVVSDDSNTGNFVTFSDKINTHKFSSVFKNVYLLCFDSSANVIKLQTK